MKRLNWQIWAGFVLSLVATLSFAWLLLGTAVAASGRAPDYNAAITSAQPDSRQGHRTRQRSKFDCLPKDVRSDEVLAYGKTSRGKVTVEKKLVEMKAQCRQGKLIDAKRREIRFFRPSCWGNPPADYLEIQQRENNELQKLKATYTVIVFGCNQMMSKLKVGITADPVSFTPGFSQVSRSAGFTGKPFKTVSSFMRYFQSPG